MRIFISYSHADGNELAVELSQELAGAGHEVFEPAVSFEPSGNVLASISAAIRTSDVVIALLTVRNPNVYYELGLAAGANVPTLVASRSRESLAFDLTFAPYVQLTGDVAADVAAIVRRVAEVASAPGKVDPRASESAELTLAEAAHDASVLERVTPSEFERLVAEVFLERGFPIRTTPRGRDMGFDLIIDADPLTVVEVKRYSRRSLVSVGAVRRLFGSMTAAGAGRAILISSSGFTKSARAAATEWPIELMTLEDLLRLPAFG